MSVKAMEWVSEARVGRSTDKCVLIALANFHHEKNDCCNPSIETISGFTELNRKTVMPALDRLKSAGFISFQKGNRRHRSYELNFKVLSPSLGTNKNADKSTNFGTKPNSPDLGTKEDISKVPKTTSHSPKNDPPKSQGLDHEQENRNNGLLKKRQISEPETYVQFAEFMWLKIQALTGSNRTPNFQTWAKSIRLLIESDGRDIETVQSVFLWANQHHFWSGNIQSAPKLRDQFDKLLTQWRQQNANASNGIQFGQDPRRLSAVERVKRNRRAAGNGIPGTG